ncbi:hypothetical protein [Rosenbergiella epipactidis]|uniref:hypothetical protein n=1 Tax=Rosenbergiella epipactidis TaxID=1544694 RepID=UPI001F4E9C94|nr:hypothetical protein [Rosenbergiella epipactidis]
MSITNDGKTPDWNTGYTEQGKHRAENNKAALILRYQNPYWQNAQGRVMKR